MPVRAAMVPRRKGAGGRAQTVQGGGTRRDGFSYIRVVVEGQLSASVTLTEPLSSSVDVPGVNRNDRAGDIAGLF
jgi:hypothetical protein